MIFIPGKLYKCHRGSFYPPWEELNFIPDGDIVLCISTMVKNEIVSSNSWRGDPSGYDPEYFLGIWCGMILPMGVNAFEDL
jgi:hypothetical protein